MSNEQNEMLEKVALLNMGLKHAPFNVTNDFGEQEQRIVVGNNGVFYELKNDWVSLCLKCSDMPVRVPYGMVEEFINYEFKEIDVSLLLEFKEQASNAFPNELCGSFLYNIENKTIRLVINSSISSSSAHVEYDQVKESDNEIVIGDIHSHPNAKAFFSHTDDEDDCVGVKISIVVGFDSADSINGIKARLCLNGMFVNVNNIKSCMSSIDRV